MIGMIEIQPANELRGLCYFVAMTTHQQARQFAKDSIDVVLQDEDPDLIRGLAGIAMLETQYGDGWKGVGKGSFNMGAVQCGSSWRGNKFGYVDTTPNSDGTSTKYTAWFRSYAKPIDGWVDLTHVVYINRGRVIVHRDAAIEDWTAMSKHLYETGYYEGFGPNKAARIQNHCRALSKAIANADLACGTIIAIAIPKLVMMDCETIRNGSFGESVRHLQREIGLVVDGYFGDVTCEAVKAFQLIRGLNPDGIVGPKTWTELESQR